MQTIERENWRLLVTCLPLVDNYSKDSVNKIDYPGNNIIENGLAFNGQPEDVATAKYKSACQPSRD